jgi:hypothetical protein
MSTNGSKPNKPLMKIHSMVLEVLHADKHNDNAFLGRPKTPALPIKTRVTQSDRPSIQSSIVATRNTTATETTFNASDICELHFFTPSGDISTTTSRKPVYGYLLLSRAKCANI